MDIEFYNLMSYSTSLLLRVIWTGLNSMAHHLLVHTKAGTGRHAWLDEAIVPACKCQVPWPDPDILSSFPPPNHPSAFLPTSSAVAQSMDNTRNFFLKLQKISVLLKCALSPATPKMSPDCLLWAVPSLQPPIWGPGQCVLAWCSFPFPHILKKNRHLCWHAGIFNTDLALTNHRMPTSSCLLFSQRCTICLGTWQPRQLNTAEPTVSFLLVKDVVFSCNFATLLFINLL